MINISYENNTFVLRNDVFDSNESTNETWKQSTGLGQKIISKTALDLGCRLKTNQKGNEFHVEVAFS